MRNTSITQFMITGLLALGLAFAACKKDPDPNDPNNTTPPETGISFTCKDSIGIQDVLVGIANLQSDCNASIFLRQGLTDFAGKIKFINLSPATYCYKASRTVNGGVVVRSGSVDVIQDQKALVNVNF